MQFYKMILEIAFSISLFCSSVRIAILKFSISRQTFPLWWNFLGEYNQCFQHCFTRFTCYKSPQLCQFWSTFSIYWDRGKDNFRKWSKSCSFCTAFYVWSYKFSKILFSSQMELHFFIDWRNLQSHSLLQSFKIHYLYP